LGVIDRVEVFAGDVAKLAKRRPNYFDAVTARSFAAAEVTARWGGELLATGGILVVSEPPQESAQRWPQAVLGRAGIVEIGVLGGVRSFRKLPNP
jgi:16S rRNA G527 N7-methylase RsmG